MASNNETWLVASYHMPGLYACRVPMTSATSTSALPAPGPGTVRLALIRIAIELIGHASTEYTLFPTIRRMPILIEPPANVAMSIHMVHVYKAREKTDSYQEGIANREYAHTSDVIRIYLQIPQQQCALFTELLRGIGYWGQADGLTQCVNVTVQHPNPSRCIQLLAGMSNDQPIQAFHTSLLTDLSDPQVTWQQIMEGDTSILDINLYIWPLTRIKHYSGSGHLLQRSITENKG